MADENSDLAVDKVPEMPVAAEAAPEDRAVAEPLDDLGVAEPRPLQAGIEVH